MYVPDVLAWLKNSYPKKFSEYSKRPNYESQILDGIESMLRNKGYFPHDYMESVAGKTGDNSLLSNVLYLDSVISVTPTKKEGVSPIKWLNVYQKYSYTNVTRHFAPIPSEIQKELDRLCELYGKTLQRFQLSLCTGEHRERIWDWRSFRNELVAALALPEEQFELRLKTLRAENKKNEAELLQYLRQRNTSSGDDLQARHWKLCLEEASRIQRIYWKSVTTKVRKQWGRFFGRYEDNPLVRNYFCI